MFPHLLTACSKARRTERWEELPTYLFVKHANATSVAVCIVGLPTCDVNRQEASCSGEVRRLALRSVPSPLPSDPIFRVHNFFFLFCCPLYLPCTSFSMLAWVKGTSPFFPFPGAPDFATLRLTRCFHVGGAALQSPLGPLVRRSTKPRALWTCFRNVRAPLSLHFTTEGGMWTRRAITCSSSTPPPLLTPTQQARLQRALARGRRRGSMQQLAKECDLPRDAVLAWMKHNQSRADDLRSVYGDDEADARARRNKQASKREGAAAATSRSTSNRGSLPPWHVRGKDKNINVTAQKTLETVFQEDRFPNDDVIRGISDVTRLPKERIIRWFKEKRKELAMNRRMPKQRTYAEEEPFDAEEDEEVPGAD
mmetsp:Transcript_3377/g.21063  ORF Transcript_3377/g.21063 Transcript_3377/m.21063 type:complete len:367 (-) Transcript_3377:527-1627(-)